MTRKNKGLLILGSFGILCIAGAIVYAAVNASPRLTQEEALKIVQTEYAGEVIDAKQQGHEYLVTLATTAGTYEITVPKRGGGIESIAKLESLTGSTIVAEADTALSENKHAGMHHDKPSSSSEKQAESVDTGATAKDTDSNSVESPSNTSKPNKAPSREVAPLEQNEKAANSSTPVPSSTTTALVSEKKASEIALKQIAGEIDDIDLHSKGDQRYYLIEIESTDGQDAVVQIHAVSGKVMSISWDNDGTDDDDDDE
ncbi:PepSY domain-containing protein [Paenibacillus sp. FSL W7-1287]|uniref:PepSY domain-containing protein n=1 Tax=Paenibacillus sp. FSL W7-1287 TaxID=2954538 RepID=UPI0030F4C74E